MDQKKPHVVLIPFPAQSHIKCMLKLAKLLRYNGLTITFVNTESNHTRLLRHGGSYEFDGFEFKTVPDGLSDDDARSSQTQEQLCAYLYTNFLASFLDIVAGLDTPPTCIICDGFMTFTNTIYAAEKLKIPVFLYWTLAACGFMAFYQAKALNDKGLVPLKDESYLTNGYLDMKMDWIPGMEETRLRDLPEHMLATKPDDPAFHYLLGAARAADKVTHMIIHTFDKLEATLVDELRSIFPQVYTIGPSQLLLNQMTQNKTENPTSNGYSLWEEEPGCVQWLNSKQPNSVVYVSFGSLAEMSIQDLLEFGWGLINSNHYFLWIITSDLFDGASAVLPREFREAIQRKGFIARWCSQEVVLNHPSVGGFLTHGGWGSLIESLSAGIPVLCWPISHDQRVNCRQVCKKWDVGMEIGRNVQRGEVGKLVRELMEGSQGKTLRKKTMQWKKEAELAASANGSSLMNIKKLVTDITTLSRN